MKRRSLISEWSITTTITGAPSSPELPNAGGLFIVFEGVEGVGKTTQIERVAAALRARGMDPLVTREPGGTAAGEAIRAVALDRSLILDPVAELLLMLAARAVFVREVVGPALEAGRVVLSDRYDLSSFAYQGGGRGIPSSKIRLLNELATGGLRPHLYVVLDGDVETSLGRREKAAADRIEREDLAFHRRVGEAYRQLAADDRDVALVDARGEIEAVFGAIWGLLLGRFPETFEPRMG